MDKKSLNEFKKKLEEEKSQLKKDLLSFASENKNISGDYDSRYPFIQGGDLVDDQANEVESYNGRLALENALETRLKEINQALVMIKDNSFGICVKCGKEIEKERLRANSAAQICLKCCAGCLKK